MTNREKAKQHFISTGEWFEGCVMHHKDVNMKTADPERYKEWRPEDLVCITRQEHIAIHKPESGKGENHPMYGRHHTPETKAKISVKSSQYRHSDESKKKIGDAHRGQHYNDGEENPFYGQHHTDEVKEKIRKARKAYWAKRKEALANV